MIPEIKVDLTMLILHRTKLSRNEKTVRDLNNVYYPFLDSRFYVNAKKLIIILFIIFG